MVDKSEFRCYRGLGWPGKGVGGESVRGLCGLGQRMELHLVSRGGELGDTRVFAMSGMGDNVERWPEPGSKALRFSTARR